MMLWQRRHTEGAKTLLATIGLLILLIVCCILRQKETDHIERTARHEPQSLHALLNE